MTSSELNINLSEKYLNIFSILSEEISIFLYVH